MRDFPEREDITFQLNKIKALNGFKNIQKIM